MKQGDELNGYRVLTRPSNLDAGKCVWAFAERDGEEYFIKEFLDPKRPRADSMGSPEDKERRFAECVRFENKHRAVMEMLRPDHPSAGNLVLAVDFFAAGTRYYKVTRRVHVAEDVVPHELDTARQSVLLGTLADSLRLLHSLDLVHGDLKPQNVLLRRPVRSDLCVAKLIDLDDAYVAGAPPDRTVMGGDALYGAPEWLGYLAGVPGACPSSLTCAVDVFAFGLLTHVYLTGRLPGFAPHTSPAAARLEGAGLVWDERLPAGVVAHLEAFTRSDPTSRPRLADVGRFLLEEDRGAWPPRRSGPPDAPPPGERPPGPSRVRVNLTGRSR